MAITTGLEFAKQYLILPDDSGGSLTTRVNKYGEKIYYLAANNYYLVIYFVSIFELFQQS